LEILTIEQTLLSYFEATAKQHNFSLKNVDEFPKDIVFEIRSNHIRQHLIEFGEYLDIDTFSSIMYWRAVYAL